MKSDLSALEKSSTFLWIRESYRKACQTWSFKGTLVAKSVGILQMWYLQSSKWPLKAAQREAVLSLLWKFPSPAAAGRGPMGWELVWLWRFKMSSCPWAFTCIWICCSEKHGDASKAQPPSPGWRGKPAWCRQMWPATCWGGEAVWLLSQALH